MEYTLLSTELCTSIWENLKRKGVDRMKTWIILISMYLVVAFLGCAKLLAPPATTTQQPSVTPQQQETEAQTAAIPSSYTPGTENLIRIRHASEVYAGITSLKTAQSFGVVQLRDIATKSHFTGVLISKSDIDVLKALVASDWVPMLIVKSPVGTNHARLVIGYNDNTKRLILADPQDKGEQINQIEMEYSEFTKSWEDPQKAFLLISAQRVNEMNIKSILGKYLPKEKVDALVIKVQSR